MPISLTGIYVHCTDDAVLVEVEGEELWIPRSVLEDCPDTDTLTRGDEIDIEVRSWWAEKNGL